MFTLVCSRSLERMIERRSNPTNPKCLSLFPYPVFLNGKITREWSITIILKSPPKQSRPKSPDPAIRGRGTRGVGGRVERQSVKSAPKRSNKRDRTVPFICNEKVHAATIPTSKNRVGSVPSSRHLPGLWRYTPRKRPEPSISDQSSHDGDLDAIFYFCRSVLGWDRLNVAYYPDAGPINHRDYLPYNIQKTRKGGDRMRKKKTTQKDYSEIQILTYVSSSIISTWS